MGGGGGRVAGGGGGGGGGGHILFSTRFHKNGKGREQYKNISNPDSLRRSGLLSGGFLV